MELPAEPDDAAALRQALAQEWQLALPSPDRTVYDEVLDALRGRVRHLLQHNRDRLMAALYILDVSEDRFHAATGKKSLDDAADALARVILEREMERVRTRRRYARSANDVPPRLPE